VDGVLGLHPMELIGHEMPGRNSAKVVCQRPPIVPENDRVPFVVLYSYLR
jgi:hypothetical protein